MEWVSRWCWHDGLISYLLRDYLCNVIPHKREVSLAGGLHTAACRGVSCHSSYVGQRLLQHKSRIIQRPCCIAKCTAVKALSQVIMHLLCEFVVLIHSCLILAAESQGRAGYPPVAPKPSVRMATGGAGPEELGQGSPVVMKKMVPVQSSRQPPSAQQGETSLETVLSSCCKKLTWRCCWRSCGRRRLLLWSSSRAEILSWQEAAHSLRLSHPPSTSPPCWGGGRGERLRLWWSQWVHHLLLLSKSKVDDLHLLHFIELLINLSA